MKKTVMFIDDDFVIRDMVEDILNMHDYTPIIRDETVDIEQELSESDINVVITDINMPRITGIEILEQVKKIDPLMPVIILTGSTDTNNLMLAIRLGAYDYLKKPFNMNEFLISVKQAVNDKELKVQNEKYRFHLEEMVSERTQQLQDANVQIEQSMLRAIMGMINALEASDEYTKGHSERVTNMSVLTGISFKMPPRSLEFLRLGALMHDIGKIGITHNVLHKPAKLSSDEYDIMKRHPAIGRKIVEPIRAHKNVLDIIEQHHEKMDGTGYPNGFKGRQLSLFVRIVAVADAYDAMTTNRPYRGKKSNDYAKSELLKYQGVHFDAEVVAHFLKVVESIEKEKKSIAKVDILNSSY